MCCGSEKNNSVSYLSIPKSKAFSSRLGHLAAVIIGIALTGELELNTGRLGGNLLSPTLLGLLSLAEGFLVAELKVPPFFFGHLAAVIIGIALTGELELNALAFVAKLLRPTLLSLFLDPSPLSVAKGHTLATLLCFAPGILPGGHRTKIPFFHPRPILLNPIQPHSLSICPALGKNQGFDLTTFAPPPIFQLLVGCLVVAVNASLELHLSGDRI